MPTKNVLFVTADMAHVTASASPIIAITKGELGYHPIQTQASVEELNQPGASAAILQSAVEASMFGWDTPAAKPALEFFARVPEMVETAL